MEGSKIFRALFIILIAITSATIFYFSSENGEISGNTSGKVIKKILAKFPEYQKLSDKRKAQIVEKLQPFVRKMAHFTIYTLLGFNLMGFFLTFKFGKILKYGLAIALGMLYAMSDEIHQMFSAGRTARVFDVGIDTCGVVFGTILIMIFSKIVYWARNSRKYKKLEKEEDKGYVR